MNKLTLWIGLAASVATIAGFAYQFTQSPPSGSSLQTNNANGINFGSIQQNQTIQVTPQPDKTGKEEFVETIREPIVEHDNQWSITGISHIINDPSEVSECGKSFPFHANIVKRSYDEENPVRIDGLVVLAKNGDRGFINIDNTIYSRLPRVDQAQLSSFLSENQKVIIDVFICGQSIGVWHADAIRISPTRRSTGPEKKAAQSG